MKGTNGYENASRHKTDFWLPNATDWKSNEMSGRNWSGNEQWRKILHGRRKRRMHR
jgi:hypothetical protein